MMALIRKLLGIGEVADLSELKRTANEKRQLVRLARSERTDKIFETLISEVRHK